MTAAPFQGPIAPLAIDMPEAFTAVPLIEGGGRVFTGRDGRFHDLQYEQVIHILHT